MVLSTDRSAASALVWFRRDLRDFDNAALHAALAVQRSVHCAFVFDTEILDGLERTDRRVTFIWHSVRELQRSLQASGGGLHVLYGRARDEIPRLAAALGVEAVYANRDYEPQAIARDAEAAARLKSAGIDWRTRKDHVIFELDELRTRAGTPFSVFTPYRNAWLAQIERRHLDSHAPNPGRRLARAPAHAMPSLQTLGFERAALPLPAGMSGGAQLFAAFKRRIADYAKYRDYPARDATSHLSAHLRFGTVSIRALARFACAKSGAGAAAWLAELIWREFYVAILSWRPDVIDRAFRPEYDALVWANDEVLWPAWCAGRTGYPIVDAAMRQLNATGAMHNRLRMVTASLLIKHMGIDWRRGERYFAQKLLDYDLASNNGGWQWCASTGCDAQPWFRIFNPVMQSRRFDPDGAYIRRWIPELARVSNRRIHAPWQMGASEQQAAACVIGRDYPAPVVRHEEARQRTIARYRTVKSK